jgi:fatty acid desaturase
MYISIYLCILRSTYVCVHECVHLSVHLSACISDLSINLCTYLLRYACMYPSSIYETYMAATDTDGQPPNYYRLTHGSNGYRRTASQLLTSLSLPTILAFFRRLYPCL